jgi:tripartite-type tricarboxylate transporter receptor subunit TctC
MKTGHVLLVAFLVMLGLGFLTPLASFAEGYPDRSIQLIIPIAPGSSMDNAARILGDELEKILGTPIVPSNKPGASGVLGTEAAIRAKKDGYTLLYAGGSILTYIPITNPEVVHYDPSKDLEPLGFHYFIPNAISVRSDSPWKTFPELVDYAKKNPGKLRVGTIGVGSASHFILELLQAITGTQFTHIPLKGAAPVVNVLGGHLEASCDGFANVKPHVDAGKMKVLLINHKIPAFPEIPTITELGYKQSTPVGWMGLWAPAGIPEAVRKTLVTATEKAVRNSKPKIEHMWGVCEYKPPAELRKMREEEYKQVYEIAAKIGLRKP